MSYRTLLGPFGFGDRVDDPLWWDLSKLGFGITELPFDGRKELVLFALTYGGGIGEGFSVRQLFFVFELLIHLLLGLPHAVVHLS